MTTAERVRELAREGKWGSQIAVELGISKQRVSQIAKAHGIVLPPHPIAGGWLKPGQTTIPKPRVITGGVEVQINHSVAGTISELLAAADLMARGWKVFMPIVSSKGHDLIAIRGEQLITIEVRSAHKNAAGHIVYAKKPDCASTHYALVITGEPVTYEPPI